MIDVRLHGLAWVAWGCPLAPVVLLCAIGRCELQCKVHGSVAPHDACGCTAEDIFSGLVFLVKDKWPAAFSGRPVAGHASLQGVEHTCA
jgi:hypothetical protein